jgi:hypothetical protein
MADENEQNEHEGEEQAPPQPPYVHQYGEAGVLPHLPDVGDALQVYWTEMNSGGPTADTYKAYVQFKDGDTLIQEKFLDCSKLEPGETAYRTVDLDPATYASIGYTVEYWIDTENNEPNDGVTYGLLNVSMSEKFGS